MELRIPLSGRLTLGNAKETEDYLFSEIKNKEHVSVVLDLADLDYIASAGLRILLKIRKMEPNFVLENVNSNVYEVLETSGFTRIIPVKRALREISIDGCTMIGAGKHGRVYRIDEETIVKVYGNEISLETIEDEKEKSKSAFLLGLPTAISFDIVKVGNQLGAVYELVDARTLGEALDKNPEMNKEYSERFVSLLKEFSSTRAPAGKFESIKQIYLNYVNSDVMKEWLIDREREKVREIIELIPESNSLVHGDFHVNNVMLQNDELVLIDLGGLTQGHPLFDLISFYTAEVSPNPNLSRMLMGLDYETIQEHYHYFLEAYFKTRDPKLLEKYDNALKALASLKMILIPAITSSVDRSLIELSVNKAKDELFPIIDELPGMIEFLTESISNLAQ